jgi:hypothetical protein
MASKPHYFTLNLATPPKQKERESTEGTTSAMVLLNERKQTKEPDKRTARIKNRSEVNATKTKNNSP